jgi:hypothetical protein
MPRVFCLLFFRFRRPQRLVQAEQSRAQRRRILKKSSSRTAHACLLNFSSAQRAAFLKRKNP